MLLCSKTGCNTIATILQQCRSQICTKQDGKHIVCDTHCRLIYMQVDTRAYCAGVAVYAKLQDGRKKRELNSTAAKARDPQQV